MLRSMSARQFFEWRAYQDLEPFDEVRADYRTASVVQAILNTLGRKKGQPAHLLKDCLLQWGAPAGPKSTEQALADVRRTMDVLMMIFGGEPEPGPGKRGKSK